MHNPKLLEGYLIELPFSNAAQAEMILEEKYIILEYLRNKLENDRIEITTRIVAVEKTNIPYTNKDIQSLMNNACGWYCLAFGHFINSSQFRSNMMLLDASTFLEMFDDLNKSVDFKKNEYILKHFFRSEDPSLRKEIEVITEEDTPGGVDMMKIPVETKMM